MNHSKQSRLLLLAGLSLGIFGSAEAQTSWKVTPVNGSWATAGNWTGLPAATVEADRTTVGTLTFDTSSITTTTHDQDKFVQGMLFTGGSNFTVNRGTGGVIYLYDGGIAVQGGTQVFNATIRPRGTSTIPIVNNGTLLDFNDDFMLHRPNNGTTTVEFSGTGTTEVQRLLRRTDGMDMNIVKSGTGTLNIVSFSTEVAGAASGTITGTATVNQGRLRINDEAALGGNPTSFNAGHLTLNGGTLTAAGTFTIDDASRGLTMGASGGTFEIEGSNVLTVANAITGGALSKTGTGTLVLGSVANNFSGATSVSNGTLLVNGSSASSAATVSGAASTLGGTGTVGGVTVGSGAFLLGGDGVTASGGLTSGGNISLTDGALIKLTLGAGGAHSSLLRTGGLWAFDNDQAFSLVLNGAEATTYTNIISGLTGSEAGLATIASWTIANPGVSGTFTNNGLGGVNLTVTVVPEPGAAVSLLGGMALLLGFQGRRRQRG